MSKWLKVVMALAAIGLLAGLAAAAKPEPPVITIALQVRTPQGQPRTFDRPGMPPAYWNQTFPVIQGDRVTITATVDPKPGKLTAARLRLDNKVLLDQAKGPWQAEVDTAGLATGYHLIEVWAEQTSPDRFQSLTTSFLVVPQSDPLLRVLLPQETGAEQPGMPKSNDPRLTSTLTSANADLAKALKGAGPVTINERSLLEIKAPKPGTSYVYTLSRGGRITYISPTLDLLTYLELTPRRVDPAGLAEGEVVLTVWATDGKGHFGPPTRVTLEIK